MSESHNSHSSTPDENLHQGLGALAGFDGDRVNGHSQSSTNGSNKVGLSRSGAGFQNGGALSPYASAPHSAPVAVSALTLDEDDDTVDLGQYLRALRRRRWLILGVVLSAVGLGALLTSFQKPIYQSAATILVSTPAGGGAGFGGGANALAGFLGGQMTSRSLGQQMAIINSSNVQRGALKRLSADAKTSIQKFSQPEIEPLREADAIAVKVKSYQPVAAAAYANAICDEYIAQSQQQNSAQVKDATRYVRTQLELVKDRLQDASAALRDYRQRNSTIDLSGETTDLIGRVGQLEGQKTGALADLAAAQAQLRAVQAQLQNVPANSRTAASIVRRPEVSSLRAELSQLRLKRIEQRREYNENSRVIQDIDKQIADVNAQLQREAQTEVGEWQPNPLRQQLVRDAAQLEGQILAAQARLRGQDLAIAGARGQLKQLPARAYDLGQLVTDEAAQREGYELLARKYQDLRIQEEQRVANARILERAAPSPSPISPRKNFNLGVSFVLGSLLACALALLVDRRDDRIHGDDDVVSTSRLPILAHIPAIDPKSQPIFAATSRKTSPLLESFRMLRINLAFANLDESLRSVVITSSQPGEGKSTSAVNLATVIAMSGSRVVLVDCDLRRPNLHSLFGLSNQNGFTTVAAGMVSLGEALQTTSVPGLRVLTSGPMPPNPSELLDSRGGRHVLQAVLDEADFVIFDCPPALLLSDAQIVATVADAVLLVVGYAQASKRDVARTSALLTRAGAKMLGVLFNKVDMGPDGAYGRYKSYAPYFDSDSNSNSTALTASTRALAANGSRADEAGIGANLPPSR